MSEPCEYEGICRKDCGRRGDDCDGNWDLMTKEEKAEANAEELIFNEAEDRRKEKNEYRSR